MPGTQKNAQRLLLLNLAFSFFSVGQVWLVQMVCYPLWGLVGPAEWPRYHLAWWHDIWGVIFIPCGLVIAGLVAMFWIRPAGVSNRDLWIGVILQVLLWGLTGAWWGRLMAELDQVSGPVYGPMYHTLLTTHWGRVALTTAYGLLMLWFGLKSFAVSAGASSGRERLEPVV